MPTGPRDDSRDVPPRRVRGGRTRSPSRLDSMRARVAPPRARREVCPHASRDRPASTARPTAARRPVRATARAFVQSFRLARLAWCKFAARARILKEVFGRRVRIGIRKRSERMRFFSYTSRSPPSLRASDAPAIPLEHLSRGFRRVRDGPRARPARRPVPARSSAPPHASNSRVAVPENMSPSRHPRRDVHPPTPSSPPPRVPPRPRRGTHLRAKRRTRDGFPPRSETRARFAPTFGAPGWSGSEFGGRVSGGREAAGARAATTVCGPGGDGVERARTSVARRSLDVALHRGDALDVTLRAGVRIRGGRGQFGDPGGDDARAEKRDGARGGVQTARDGRD